MQQNGGPEREREGKGERQGERKEREGTLQRSRLKINIEISRDVSSWLQITWIFKNQVTGGLCVERAVVMTQENVRVF